MGYEDVDLIEPVKVEIEQLDKVATPVSTGVAGRRDVLNHTVRKKIVIDAQVVFGKTPSDEQITMFKSQMGADETIRGYMVVRTKDLTALNTKLQRGDKIVKVGDTVFDMFLAHGTNDPSAHFSSIGGFTLLKVFFGDRNPPGGIGGGR